MNKIKRENPPSKEKIAEYWDVQLPELEIDFRNPHCWACQKEEPNRSYNKSRLQICPIIPHALGGTMEPANLFLLCCDCHSKASDTTNRELFIQWCLNTEFWLQKELRELTAALKSEFGDFYDSEELIKITKSPEFRAYFAENGIASAGKLKHSTYAACLSTYYNNLYNQQVSNIGTLRLKEAA